MASAVGGAAAGPEALLRAVPFFRDLDRVDAARLLGALEEVRFAPGTRIFGEGDDADALYLLESGRVVISVRVGDRERKLAEVGSPGHFGELGLLLARRTSSATAASEARAWRLPRERFEQVVREQPAIALAAATTLAQLLERRQRALVGAPAPSAARPLTLESRVRARRRASRLAGAAVAVAIPALLWTLPPAGALSQTGWHAALVLVGAAVAWLFEPVPDFVVALLMATAWGVLGLAPIALSFGGFASSSWVVALGALALAAVMTRSGLLFRVALLLLRVFPATHRGQVAALLLGGVVVTPLVPLSVARVAAIAPLSLELAQALGYAARSRASAALAFAGLSGYWYFSSVFLTGLATNFFVVELLSPADRARFGWLSWLVSASPLGLACLVGAAIALLALFPPEPAPPASGETIRRQQRVLGPLTSRERVALLAVGVLLAGLLLQPVAHVDTEWLAMASLAVAAAGAGLDRERFRTAIDWGFLVFFGVLLGSGGVLKAAGVDTAIAAALVPVARAVGDPGLVVVLLAVLVVAVRFVLPSRPTMLLLSLAFVPVAAQLGFSPWIAGFVVLVSANVWIFPYQGLEYLIARDATRGLAFTDRQGMAMGAALTATRLLAVAASVPVWKAMGLVG